MRLILSTLLFCISYLVLFFLDNRLLNSQKIIEDLKLLEYLIPPIQNYIIKAGYIIIALLLSIKFYFKGSKQTVDFIRSKIFNTTTDFLYIPEHSDDLLDYRNNIIRLIGREYDLNRLNDFLNKGRIFSWCWMIGETGCGKSRLALHWIELLKIKSKYHVGFYRKPSNNNFLNNWTPRKPTVVIIDDASEIPEEVINIIERLSLISNKSRKPVRILLIDRTESESLKKLSVENRYNDFLYSNNPIAIQELNIDDFDLICKEVSKLYKNPPIITQEIKKIIFEISSGSPLIMILALDTYFASGKIEFNSKVTLLQRQYERMIHKIKSAGLPDQYFDLLVLSTLVRGLSWNADFLSEFPGGHDHHLFGNVFGQKNRESIPIIKPDLLAEFFILEAIPRETRSMYKIIDTAWIYNPNAIATRLFHLHRDFPDNDILNRIDKVPEGKKQVELWILVRIYLIYDKLSNIKIEHVIKYWHQIKEFELSNKEEISIQTLICYGAVNTIGVFGKYKKFYELDDPYQTLIRISKNHPNNQEIQYELVKGAFNLLIDASINNETNIFNDAYDKIKEISERFQDNEHIQIELAKASTEVIRYYRKDKELWRCEVAYFNLNKALKRFPSNEEIQVEYAEGVVSSLFSYGLANRIKEFKEAVNKFLEVLNQSPQSEIYILRLTRYIAHAVEAFGFFRRWKELNRAYRKLEELFELSTRSIDMQYELMYGTAQSIMYYAIYYKWTELHNALDKLEMIYNRFPENEKLLPLIMQSYQSSSVMFFDNQKMAELDVIYEKLKLLSIRFPQDENIKQTIDTIKRFPRDENIKQLMDYFNVKYPEHR
jgi:hypothetical protein